MREWTIAELQAAYRSGETDPVTVCSEYLARIEEIDRSGPAWIIDHLIGDYYSGGGMSTAPAISGAPHLTMPIGYAHELPVGLSLVGALHSDEMLLGIAAGIERVLHARRPPRFLPASSGVDDATTGA